MFKTNKTVIFFSIFIIIVIGYFLLKKDNTATEPVVKDEVTKDWIVFLLHEEINIKFLTHQNNKLKILLRGSTKEIEFEINGNVLCIWIISGLNLSNNLFISC